jgi:hypothetical protein
MSARLVQPDIGFPLSKNSTVPDGSYGPGRLAGGATTAVYEMTFCVVAEAGTWTETELESRPTAMPTLALLDPGAFDAVPGVKTAMTCAGDPAAANDATQLALVLDGLTGSPVHPLIGEPWFSNVMVPDTGSVGTLLTVPSKVTGWLVTTEVEETASDVLLGLADWVRVCGADEVLPFFAVIVVVVVEWTRELVIVTLHWPLISVGPQDNELNETGEPL